MKINSYKYLYYTLAFICLCIVASCSKMDSTYSDFVKDGEIIYIGKADSLKLHPGDNRIMISGLLQNDPKVVKCKVFWNNKLDSLEVPVQKTLGIDSVNILIGKIAEGSYTFDFYTYDEFGHASIKVDVSGEVFGEKYKSSLLNRSLKRAIINGNNANLIWYDGSSKIVGVKIKYEDQAGVFHEKLVAKNEYNTVLPNYKAGSTFEYRTLYLPVELAIDTFYSQPQQVYPLKEYSRVGWTGSVSSLDANRGFQNLIDNNLTTIWHSSKATDANYPQTITVDMGKLVSNIGSFFFIQRTPLDGPVKLIEIQISNDGNTWTSLGGYELENSGDLQFVNTIEPQTFRHFKIICKNDHKGGKFATMAEIGVYGH